MLFVRVSAPPPGVSTRASLSTTFDLAASGHPSQGSIQSHPIVCGKGRVRIQSPPIVCVGKVVYLTSIPWAGEGPTDHSLRQELEDSTPSWDSSPITMRGWLHTLSRNIWPSRGSRLGFPTVLVNGRGVRIQQCTLWPDKPTHRGPEEQPRVQAHVRGAHHCRHLRRRLGALPPRTRELSENDLKKYYPSVCLCRRKDRALARQITKTITTRSERKKWREKCKPVIVDSHAPVSMRRASNLLKKVAQVVASRSSAEPNDAGVGSTRTSSGNTRRTMSLIMR